MNEVSERLRQLLQAHLEMGGASQTALASHLGIAPSAVSRILSGQRQISGAELIGIKNFFNMSMGNIERALSDKTGTDVDRFFTSIGEFDRDFGDCTRIAPFVKGNDDIVVPSYLLHAEHQLNHHRLYWIRCADDAMSPTIEKNDLIVIDESSHGVSGIYAIEHIPDHITIRRIDGGIWSGPELIVKVRTDNPKYSDFESDLIKLRPKGQVILRVTSKVG